MAIEMKTEVKMDKSVHLGLSIPGINKAVYV